MNCDFQGGDCDLCDLCRYFLAEQYADELDSIVDRYPLSKTDWLEKCVSLSGSGSIGEYL